MNTSIFARSTGLLLSAFIATALCACDEGSATGSGGAGGGDTSAGGEGGAGGGAGGNTSTGGTTGTTEPAKVSVIDDMEDGDGSVLAADGRAGAWYTYNDETATGMQDPIVGDPFEMTPLNPPRDGSAFAANTKGSGFDTWGSGFGFDLSVTAMVKGAYDASAYSGITFWAKVGAGSAGAVRVNLGDKNTTPEGGICEDGKCSDDFGKDITVTESWKEFNIAFADMKQVGWSMVLLPSIEKSALYSVHFQTGKGVKFDIWIDDIAFYE